MGISKTTGEENPDKNAGQSADIADATNLGGFTIPEWCKAYRVCRATFYNLQKNGQGPAVIKIGNRSIVTYRASRKWEDERLEASRKVIA